MNIRTQNDYTPPVHWGTRLKSSRMATGMTQVELAEASGTSQQTISRIENGEIEASREIIPLAQALKVTAEWLMTGLGDPDQVKPPPVDLEQLPLAALMEAMTRRLAAEDPAIRAMVADLVTNYVRNPTDYAQIAKLLKRLLPANEEG